MKKIIISLIIYIITFEIIFLNINSKENKKLENENISIILETEEGNLEINTFPDKEKYIYIKTLCENTNDEVTPTFNKNTWKLNLSVEKKSIDGNFNCTVHFKEKPEAGFPKLDETMIPVYYDEANNVWRKADESNSDSRYEWYDYEEKKWANSVTVREENREKYLIRELGTKIEMEDILTMQVWIPRYKYKVWNYNSDGTSISEVQEIEIELEKGTESTGEIICTDNIQGSDGDGTSEICKLGNETCTNDLCNNKYYTHPAFTFGNKELEGFWVGKFELSSDIECTATENSGLEMGCNLTTINPLIKPNVTSWGGVQVSVFDKVLRAMKDSGNIYGFTNNVDTHMIKNSEWGAIAYFSHSKYGTCVNGSCNEVQLNSTSSITGCGPQADNDTSFGTFCNSYDTTLGKLSSTTGNIYGVYDMSGGKWEYSMGNMIGPDDTLMLSGDTSNRNSGYTGMLYDSGNYINYVGTYNYPESKYYNKYSFFDSKTQITASKLGDGLREVFMNNVCWYNDYCSFVGLDTPWTVRGGHSNHSNSTGLFYNSRFDGGVRVGGSSRLVIVN